MSVSSNVTSDSSQFRNEITSASLRFVRCTGSMASLSSPGGPWYLGQGSFSSLFTIPIVEKCSKVRSGYVVFQ